MMENDRIFSVFAGGPALGNTRIPNVTNQFDKTDEYRTQRIPTNKNPTNPTIRFTRARVNEKLRLLANACIESRRMAGMFPFVTLRFPKILRAIEHPLPQDHKRQGAFICIETMKTQYGAFLCL